MLRVEAWHSKSKEDIRELEQGLKDLTKVFSQLPEVGDNAELGQKQEIWQKRLQDFQGRHRQQLKSWHNAGQEMLQELVPEQKTEVKMPDFLSATVMLEEARAEVESLRLLRQKELKNRCAEEIGGHATLQERVSSRMASRLNARGEFLDQEVQQRRERHQALVEVVAQMSKSLQSTIAEDEEAETLTPSPQALNGKSSPSSGVSSRWRSEKRR